MLMSAFLLAAGTTASSAAFGERYGARNGNLFQSQEVSHRKLLKLAKETHMDPTRSTTDAGFCSFLPTAAPSSSSSVNSCPGLRLNRG